MSAGLEASTVTPGSTAPDVSRTTPATDCAGASVGEQRMPNAQDSTVRVVDFSAFMACLPLPIEDAAGRRVRVAVKQRGSHDLGYLDRQHLRAVAEGVEPRAELVEHRQQQVRHVRVLREPQVTAALERARTRHPPARSAAG